MKLILTELEQILKTVQGVNKVSHGKPLALVQEDTFNAVYIVPDNTRYKPFKQGTKADSYDKFMYVKLFVNSNNESDELYYTDLCASIINTVLSDSKIWTVLVDRDVIAITYDEYESYPKKGFEILFEFRFRDSCTN